MTSLDYALYVLMCPCQSAASEGSADHCGLLDAPTAATVPSAPSWSDTQRIRNGFNTRSASTAPIQSNAIATAKMGIQLPVAVWRTFPSGTSNDAVPLAV